MQLSICTLIGEDRENAPFKREFSLLREKQRNFQALSSTIQRISREREGATVEAIGGTY